MPELKPSLFPYLYLRCLCVLGGTQEGSGLHAHALVHRVGFIVYSVVHACTPCWVYSKELLFVTNAISKGFSRVVVYSVFGVGAEIPLVAPRLTWDRSTTYNIRTTLHHDAGRAGASGQWITLQPGS
jgi:hypothetical protein